MDKHNFPQQYRQIRLTNEDGVVFKTYQLLFMQIDEDNNISIGVR